MYLEGEEKRKKERKKEGISTHKKKGKQRYSPRSVSRDAKLSFRDLFSRRDSMLGGPADVHRAPLCACVRVLTHGRRAQVVVTATLE